MVAKLLEEEHTVMSLMSPEMTSAGDAALRARAMAGRGETASRERQRPGAGPCCREAVLALLAPAACRPGQHLPPPSAVIQVGTGVQQVPRTSQQIGEHRTCQGVAANGVPEALDGWEVQAAPRLQEKHIPLQHLRKTREEGISHGGLGAVTFPRLGQLPV